MWNRTNILSSPHFILLWNMPNILSSPHLILPLSKFGLPKMADSVLSFQHSQHDPLKCWYWFAFDFRSNICGSKEGLKRVGSVNNLNPGSRSNSKCELSLNLPSKKDMQSYLISHVLFDGKEEVQADNYSKKFFRLLLSFFSISQKHFY